VISVSFTPALFSLVSRASPILDDSTPEVSTLSRNSSRISSAMPLVQLHSDAIAADELRMRVRSATLLQADGEHGRALHFCAMQLPAPPCD
jgi:hypothetical protein